RNGPTPASSAPPGPATWCSWSSRSWSTSPSRRSSASTGRCRPRPRRYPLGMTFPSTGERVLATTEDMRAFGAELGASLAAGDVVILDGPLGAGKTTLTQGIASGMGVRGRVTSPTFTIAREHRSTVGGPDLVHVDAYRLFGEEGPAADSGGSGMARSEE